MESHILFPYSVHLSVKCGFEVRVFNMTALACLWLFELLSRSYTHHLIPKSLTCFELGLHHHYSFLSWANKPNDSVMDSGKVSDANMVGYTAKTYIYPLFKMTKNLNISFSTVSCKQSTSLAWTPSYLKLLFSTVISSNLNTR